MVTSVQLVNCAYNFTALAAVLFATICTLLFSSNGPVSVSWASEGRARSAREATSRERAPQLVATRGAGADVGSALIAAAAYFVTA
jgi:hypothetical protein